MNASGQRDRQLLRVFCRRALPLLLVVALMAGPALYFLRRQRPAPPLPGLRPPVPRPSLPPEAYAHRRVVAPGGAGYWIAAVHLRDPPPLTCP